MPKKLNKLFVFSLLIIFIQNNYALEQQPFVCKTLEAGLGHPIIDNQQKIGMPVKNQQGQIIGYSKDCYAKPYIKYLYKTEDNVFKPLIMLDSYYPADLAWIDKKQHIPYIVKVETGVQDRFIYNILILEDPLNKDAKNNKQIHWNKKLIYYFGGGVGIGYSQAANKSLDYITDISNLLKEIDFLKQQYAVVYSTGTASSTHYNLQLGLKVAQNLKQKFNRQYPGLNITLGFGGSGGAIQQYVYSEQDPNLLDGALVSFSYPDMLTQTIHVGDCELLEHYFDVKSSRKWDWDSRQLIEGMYSSNNMPMGANKIGSSSCVNGWRGLVPLVMNPHFSNIKLPQDYELQSAWHQDFWNATDKKWDYGAFLANEKGIVEHSYDNEGVQYGLVALKQGKISKNDFFELNFKIGGWKPTIELQPEQDFSKNPWSYHNAYQVINNNPAKRSVISKNTLLDIKNSGLIFKGNSKIPIIDWREHNDYIGDMHFALGSFMARNRILRAQGNFDNQIIWMTALNKKNYKQLNQALEILNQWVLNKSKPKSAIDACFNAEGDIIYQGNDAWSLNTGFCAKHKDFKISSTSRIMSGGDKYNETFKCELIPVEAFYQKGGYQPIKMTATDLITLKNIFKTGVCR